MKTRLILIVCIGLLAVTVFMLKGRTEMKHGRLHHWLVVHNLRRTGEYQGQKIGYFLNEYCFQTTDGKVYEIWPDGKVRKAEWKPVLDPASWVTPKSIIIPTNGPRDPNFVAG